MSLWLETRTVIQDLPGIASKTSVKFRKQRLNNLWILLCDVAGFTIVSTVVVEFVVAVLVSDQSVRVRADCASTGISDG